MNKKDLGIAAISAVIIAFLTIPTINNLPLPGAFVALGTMNVHGDITHRNGDIHFTPQANLDAPSLIVKVAPYCTESIWLGKLNYMNTGFNTWKSVEYILDVIETFPDEIKEKIRLKDSIRNLVEKMAKK